MTYIEEKSIFNGKMKPYALKTSFGYRTKFVSKQSSKVEETRNVNRSRKKSMRQYLKQELLKELYNEENS